TLRIYALEMRDRRRMRAEEKAHRLPVLLSFPLVACMLPVMIRVLMLPDRTSRIYALERRARRRMRAEEKAHRLPVLLSFPLVACMLPVMIGVLMLPAVIRVMRTMLPAMSGD